MSRTRLFLTVASGLLLIAPLSIAVAGLSGIGHRWVDILAQFVGPAFAATLVLTAGVALARMWIASGMGGVVALSLLAAGWPQWAPTKGHAADGPELTVYSANLWALNRDVEAIAASVAASDADLLVLIEVGDTPSAAIDRITAGYRYRIVGRRAEGPHGAARFVFASRHPMRLIRVEAAQLDAQAIEALTPLGPITVAGVHLTRPWPFQFQWGQIIQAQGLADWSRTVKGPLIVAGDFNTVSSARIGRQIQAQSSLIPAPGWPGTWPSALPSAFGMTIDQVWRSPDLALVERRVGRGTGSDHRPVITRFRRAAATPGP